MAIRVTAHSIDFVQDRASISLEDGIATIISVTIKLPSPGNQTEDQLKAASLAEAKRVLQEALSLL